MKKNAPRCDEILIFIIFVGRQRFRRDVFVTITVGLFPLWEWQILLILWVFLLGSCPFSVFVSLSGLLSSRRNANLAGGFAGRLRLCRVVVLVNWICC